MFGFNSKPIDRDYISDLDRFLQEFDKKKEAFSKSRMAEIKKYKKITELRDNSTKII